MKYSLFRKLNLEILICSLICLLPILLITGNFLPDLSISIIGIIFLYLTFKKNLFQFYKKKIIYIFFLWCIYLIFRSILSEYPILSLESSLFYWRFGVFSIAFWYILEHSKVARENQFIKYLYLSVCFSLIIILLDAYFQFIFQKNILGNEYNGVRLSGLFDDEFILGRYLFMLSSFFLILFFIDEEKELKKNKILVLSIIYILSLIMIFISGERTAFFTSIFFLFLLVFSLNGYLFQRIIITISIVLSIIIILISFPEIKKRMIDLTTSHMTLFNNNQQEFILFTHQHQSIFNSSLKMYYKNKIFGLGPKTFREHCSQEEYKVINSYDKVACSTHPHNFYLQGLSEIGIIGTLPLIITFLFSFYRLLKNFYYKFILKAKYLSNYESCIYILIFINMWPLQPNYNLFHNWNSIMIFMLFGFILTILYPRKIKE